MTWVLVYITLTFNSTMTASVEGEFESMDDCFWARDYLAVMAGGTEGSYPPGEQAVCILSEDYLKDQPVVPQVDNDSIRG